MTRYDQGFFDRRRVAKHAFAFGSLESKIQQCLSDGGVFPNFCNTENIPTLIFDMIEMRPMLQQ